MLSFDIVRAIQKFMVIWWSSGEKFFVLRTTQPLPLGGDKEIVLFSSNSATEALEIDRQIKEQRASRYNPQNLQLLIDRQKAQAEAPKPVEYTYTSKFIREAEEAYRR